MVFITKRFFSSYVGEGTFGRVVQAQAPGIVEGTSDKYVVAIKMCRGKAISTIMLNNSEFVLLSSFCLVGCLFFSLLENALHQTSLWDELQLMKKLESHNNIVNLLGCCSTPSKWVNDYSHMLFS